MGVTDAPFDLVEVKLAPPSTRPGNGREDGRDRGAGRIACAARERGRAGRIRQDHLPRALGRGRPTRLRLGRARRPRRRPGRLAALRRRRHAPPRAAAARGVRCPVGPGRSGWAKRVVRLANALAARERPFVLAFDDLHAVNNPACLDVIAELLESVPAGSQIAIASREEPALPLGRWRAHGWVHELGPASCGWTSGEAELLLQAAGVELGEAEVTELTERTEGWPPACTWRPSRSRPALRARRAPPPSPATTGSWPITSAAELISRLPDDEARFLKHTSVLERMCGGLCDSVVESTGSADVLERLERANSFVVPLDRRGEWYRYHHLFAELLRNELERAEPDVAAELNRRAMAWCIAHDLPEAAVVYGHAAGETDAVAGLGRCARAADPLRRSDGDPGWVAEVVQRGRSEALPRARRRGRLAPGADGPVRGGGGLARARRGRDVDDPALGWQRDDRALGGDPARGDDARRRRPGGRRRRPGDRAARAGEPLEAGRAHPPRHGPCPARRPRERRSRFRRDDRARTRPGQPARDPGPRTALPPRGEARSVERGGGARSGGRKGWSRPRVSPTTRPPH